MGKASRPAKEGPTKEPAEGSRQTVDEALRRTAPRKPGPPPADKTQADVPPGRQALDD